MIDFAKPVIPQLAAMSDEDFKKVMGLDDMFTNMRKHITDMNNLTGKGAKEAERRVRNALTPDIHEERLGWILSDAEHANKRNEVADVCCD